MFHHLDKYAKDDNFVKLIFDHLRNIGLITLVLGAAAWKQKHLSVGASQIWDHAVIFLLMILGVSLLWINHENLFHKIRNSNISRWLKVFLALSYAIIFSELIRYALSARA